MTEEQQELYDIVSDWWDDVFVAASFKGRDACLVDLVNAIIDWTLSSSWSHSHLKASVCQP